MLRASAEYAMTGPGRPSPLARAAGGAGAGSGLRPTLSGRPDNADASSSAFGGAASSSFGRLARKLSVSGTGREALAARCADGSATGVSRRGNFDALQATNPAAATAQPSAT